MAPKPSPRHQPAEQDTYRIEHDINGTVMPPRNGTFCPFIEKTPYAHCQHPDPSMQLCYSKQFHRKNCQYHETKYMCTPSRPAAYNLNLPCIQKPKQFHQPAAGFGGLLAILVRQICHKNKPNDYCYKCNLKSSCFHKNLLINDHDKGRSSWQQQRPCDPHLLA